MSVEHFAALICAWLASYFINSTLMLGAAWFLTRRLSSRFDTVSELIWRLALCLPVITAIAQRLNPLSSAQVVSISSFRFTPPAMTVSAVPTYLWVVVAAIWIAGAAIGLLQLGWLQRSLRRAISRRSSIDAARSTALRQLGGLGMTRVSIVEGLSVPLALANEICLPAWVVNGMDADEYRAVVAHELAHVRRRDAIWRPLAAAATRIFFFQPFNWLASERLRELSECICDAEAIAATKSTLPLASALEAVAVRNSRHVARLSLVPAMDAGRSFTLKRVARILASSASRPVKTSRWLVAAVIAVGGAGVLLAPRVTLPDIAFLRYTINAQDPAGHFTLTVERGRVVGATIGGRLLPPAQVVQDGGAVKIIDPITGVFSLRLTASGGIHWDPRKRGS